MPNFRAYNPKILFSYRYKKNNFCPDNSGNIVKSSYKHTLSEKKLPRVCQFWKKVDNLKCKRTAIFWNSKIFSFFHYRKNNFPFFKFLNRYIHSTLKPLKNDAPGMRVPQKLTLQEYFKGSLICALLIRRNNIFERHTWRTFRSPNNYIVISFLYYFWCFYHMFKFSLGILHRKIDVSVT